jgi:hypothetical protein
LLRVVSHIANIFSYRIGAIAKDGIGPEKLHTSVMCLEVHEAIPHDVV